MASTNTPQGNPPMCKDCEHAIPYKTIPLLGPSSYGLAKCDISARNYVDGSRRYCSSERADLEGRCGEAGTRFSQRKPLWLRLVQWGAA